MSDRTLSMMQYEDWRTPLNAPKYAETNWRALQNAQPAYTSEQLRSMTDAEIARRQQLDLANSEHDLWAALIGDSEARHALITQKLSGIGNSLNDLKNVRGAGEL
jgi:hypothetical protein